MDHMHHHDDTARTDPRWKWALAGFLAIGGFFLWSEHGAHLLGALPYVLVLACPLLHLFHRHGGHAPHDADEQRAQSAAESAGARKGAQP